MKRLKNILFVIVLLGFVVNSCQKPERDNPWDELARLDPEEWAPQNFQIEDVSITEKKLSWTYDDKNIEGFKLDRKKGDEPWQIGFQTFDKEARSWNDTNILPDPELNFQYKLYAYAGNNQSREKNITLSSELHPPNNLIITPNNISSITLNWHDKNEGEHSFRILRKYESFEWDELATTKDTSWNDNDFKMNTVVHYSVEAFYQDYTSERSETSFVSQIPAVENLTLQANSLSSVTLSWNYNVIGHVGFYIMRKTSNGVWEVLVDSLDPEQVSFEDNEVDLFVNRYIYSLAVFVNNSYSDDIQAVVDRVEIGSHVFGGVVFVLNGNGGLVCTEFDYGENAQWGCYGNFIGETGTELGVGANNTMAIVAYCSDAAIASRISYELILNGYSDWFLPSKDELQLMYQNLKMNGIGNFSDDYYWSSSEHDANMGWLQDFEEGDQITSNKHTLRCVRSIRAFYRDN